MVWSMLLETCGRLDGYWFSWSLRGLGFGVLVLDF